MAYQKLTKAEKNKRTKERLEREKEYKKNYQRENYKFLSIKFKLNDERDIEILKYIDSQSPKPKVDTIKEIIYEHITKIKESK